MQNPEIKLKFQNLEASRSEQEAAKGGWRPRVDLEAAVGPKSYLTPSTAASSYSGSSATIQLRQTLFGGCKKFCVNGYLAGNCCLAWSRDDRRDETLTRRAD
ncbi:TolC family protein [Rhodoferax sp. PAMC 29310]|uniref:TolC family protein n=1 Tax=Rhodoferax sp. PAMC 29310 TaxID=2822760 RepID=UPI001B322A27